MSLTEVVHWRFRCRVWVPRLLVSSTTYLTVVAKRSVVFDVSSDSTGRPTVYRTRLLPLNFALFIDLGLLESVSIVA